MVAVFSYLQLLKWYIKFCQTSIQCQKQFRYPLQVSLTSPLFSTDMMCGQVPPSPLCNVTQASALREASTLSVAPALTVDCPRSSGRSSSTRTSTRSSSTRPPSSLHSASRVRVKIYLEMMNVELGLLIIYSNLSTSLKVSNVEVVVVVRHNFILKTYSNSGDSWLLYLGLTSNQTTVFLLRVYSYNLKGRSEVVTLPKITLDAEENCHVSLKSDRKFDFNLTVCS